MTPTKLLAAITIATTTLTAQSALAQGGGLALSMVGSPHLGLRHAAITVSDIDATVAFYAKAVPYKVVKRFRINGSAFPKMLLSRRHAEVEVALVSMPTGFIQLMDFDPGKATPPKSVFGAATLRMSDRPVP